MTRSTSGAELPSDLYIINNPPLKWKTLGFAVVIILGIGALVVAGVGIGGLSGAIDKLGQVNSIIITATGSGIIFLIVGIISSIKNHQKSRGIERDQPFLNRGDSVDFANTIMQFNDTELNKSLNGVYALSNESRIERSIERLSEIQKDKRTCHIGVGALHNFDIMAVRRSSYGIIFDFNPDNQVFINKSLELITNSATSAEFVKQIIKYMEMDLQKYNRYEGYDSPISRMQSELKRSSSWLWEGDVSKFQHIKKLAERRRIVAINQDFAKSSVFQKLIAKLEQLDCSVDTLYLSNLWAYLTRDKFKNTIDILTGSNPMVIYCTSPANCQCKNSCRCSKEQNLCRGQEFGDIYPLLGFKQ